MNDQYVLGIDQGSSGSRAMLLDGEGRVRGYGYQAVPRLFPQPGWVEQNPATIADSVRIAVAHATTMAACDPRSIAACGITSQRDTVFAWDHETGQPIGHAITWQDLRTVPLVEQSNLWEHAAERRDRLGQFPGAYSSAMHMAWRMRYDPAFRRAADEQRLRCSVAAGWLVRALGRPAEHALDVSLMQSMSVWDPRRRELWQDWVSYLNLPVTALPHAVPTVHPFGEIAFDGANGPTHVPVLAMIADQQAALFGYDCRTPAAAAATHGTASFVNVCAGTTPPPQGTSKSYLAWQIDEPATWTLEADTTVTGAVIRWMQEQMGWLQQPADLGPLALSVPNAASVVFVPAFTGLGVPTEDRSARGTLLGMTLDTTPAHIARAFLDSIAFQMRDILASIQAEAGLAIPELHVGGGISASDTACQIWADMLGLPIVRAANAETSVRAAALLAGIGAGIWPTIDALPPLAGPHTRFEPRLATAERDARYNAWQDAVERARHWNH